MPDPVNILLVDDQPAKLLSYEVILQELGENLLVAQSAREALEHLLRTDVAVILVDVCMPEQDGFELVELIRARAGESFDVELEGCDETGRLGLPAELADGPAAAHG